MKQILLALLLLFSLQLSAQTRQFDIINYTALKGWKKDSNNSSVTYSIVNNKKKGWCQITLYKSTASKGTVDADFESEWKELILPTLKITNGPIKEAPIEQDGWKIQVAGAKAVFESNEMMLLHTVVSGYNKRVSIIAKTNHADYLDDIEKFKSAIQLIKPAEKKLTENKKEPTPNKISSTTPLNNKFKFTSTNFDDGWKAEAREDWTEITKGNITAFIHYPREGTVFPADPDVLVTAVWNILVAPRYSSLRDFKTSYINDYNRPYLGMGYAKSNVTGKELFVLLIRQGGEWIEISTPDKTSFIQQFKFDPETIRYDSNTDLIKTALHMASYNRFAIAATDFTGKWTTNFSNNTFYVNVYTGNSAGMSTYSSGESFEFFAGQKYKWNLAAATHSFGRTNAAQAKGEGKFSVPNNWQIYFSDIEGKPKTYDAWFSAIKGGRILWLDSKVGTPTAFAESRK